MLTMNWPCKALTLREIQEHIHRHNICTFKANLSATNTQTKLHRIIKLHRSHLRQLP